MLTKWCVDWVCFTIVEQWLPSVLGGNLWIGAYKLTNYPVSRTIECIGLAYSVKWVDSTNKVSFCFRITGWLHSPYPKPLWYPLLFPSGGLQYVCAWTTKASGDLKWLRPSVYCRNLVNLSFVVQAGSVNCGVATWLKINKINSNIKVYYIKKFGNNEL